MIVAAIVAILAAVTVPLMMANRQKAVATEGQAGLGVIRSALRVYKSAAGGYPESESGKNATELQLLNIRADDLDGKYFKAENYVLTTVTPSNFLLTATVTTNQADSGETVTLSERGEWGGTMQ